MTVPDHLESPPMTDASNSKLLRLAIWVAIGALIAAAIVCVVWVLVGPANDFIGRAFLTILLLAAFAGVAILDAHLAPRRPAWFALTSMIVWVVILIVGAFMIWMPLNGYGYGFGRFFSFLLIVLILQLGVLHVRLYAKAYLRYVTVFTRIVAGVTVALVTILAFMLVFALMLNEFLDFGEWYWRLVVAITILAAVGTALIPLINVLFAPKKPRPAHLQAPVYAPVAWPTYVDGVTPLPVLADGTPDWNAYYTGYPSQTSQALMPGALHPVGEQPPVEWQTPAEAQAAPQQWPAPEQAPQQWSAPEQQQWPAPAQPPAPAGYEGYPPPPPLPPQQ
ncbi:hypothetical protein [Microbacterium sp. Root61]|uniref:hypothetical protein n=1 Tax=Microbacterium sp. Root61 TaxID=1736570 RepID=UPI000ABB170D|nr:hypothetical protein [Microbacterium sp. Root61]